MGKMESYIEHVISKLKILIKPNFEGILQNWETTDGWIRANKGCVNVETFLIVYYKRWLCVYCVLYGFCSFIR